MSPLQPGLCGLAETMLFVLVGRQHSTLFTTLFSYSLLLELTACLEFVRGNGKASSTYQQFKSELDFWSPLTLKLASVLYVAFELGHTS